MAKKDLGEKAERVLKLLLGVRHPKIAQALVRRGFGVREIDEGFALLRAVTELPVSLAATATPAPSLLQQLDRWENEWFPVASASLARHFPAVHARVFLNLAQAEGPAVVVTVGTFLARVAALERADGPHGKDGPAARALLERRGLTDEVLAEAAELLAAIGTLEAPSREPAEAQAQRDRLAAAEEALWAWYLEWSRIARVAIKDKALLRRLGFSYADRATDRTSEPAEPDPARVDD